MNRKQLIESWKSRPLPSGVFRVSNQVSGRAWIEGCLDMPARWNRHRFQLELGRHEDPAFQADWDQYGAESFVFEVVSDYEPPMEPPPGFDARSEIELLELLYRDQCGQRTVGYF